MMLPSDSNTKLGGNDPAVMLHVSGVVPPTALIVPSGEPTV
ncbi:MAG: hypothetical protein N2595_09520 [bacterium]|nr:hypothetical protein [bacterium]